MAMVVVDASCLKTGGLAAQVMWLGLRVGSHFGADLHSPDEPSELSQWPGHDDITINIVVVIIIKYYYYTTSSQWKRWLTSI